MGLKAILNCKDVKGNVIADCRQLMDKQVASKKGLGGMALKTTYGVVKGIGPSYLADAIGGLLPAICDALDPIWEEGLQNGNPAEYLAQHDSRSAEMILGVTDARIEKSSNKVVRGAYNKLRKSVKGDVEEAVPGLAQIISTYAQS